jgi:hypothetical protein
MWQTCNAARFDFAAAVLFSHTIEASLISSAGQNPESAS